MKQHITRPSPGTQLPARIVDAIHDAGYRVDYADKDTTRWWNSRLKAGEPREFGGFYFYHERNPTQVWAGFRSASGCYRACWGHMLETGQTAQQTKPVLRRA